MAELESVSASIDLSAHAESRVYGAPLSLSEGYEQTSIHIQKPNSPITQWTDEGNRVEISVPGQRNVCMDLGGSYLVTELQLHDSKAAAIINEGVATDPLQPIVFSECFTSTLFSDIELSLGGSRSDSSAFQRNYGLVGGLLTVCDTSGCVTPSSIPSGDPLAFDDNTAASGYKWSAGTSYRTMTEHQASCHAFELCLTSSTDMPDIAPPGAAKALDGLDQPQMMTWRAMFPAAAAGAAVPNAVSINPSTGTSGQTLTLGTGTVGGNNALIIESVSTGDTPDIGTTPVASAGNHNRPGPVPAASSITGTPAGRQHPNGIYSTSAVYMRQLMTARAGGVAFPSINAVGGAAADVNPPKISITIRLAFKPRLPEFYPLHKGALIPPNIPLQLGLIRGKDNQMIRFGGRYPQGRGEAQGAFATEAAGVGFPGFAPTVSVTSLELHLKTVRLTEAASAALSQKMLMASPMYPVRRVFTEFREIPAGSSTADFDLFQGRPLSAVLICFIRSDVLQKGRLDTSILNLSPYSTMFSQFPPLAGEDGSADYVPAASKSTGVFVEEASVTFAGERYPSASNVYQMTSSLTNSNTATDYTSDYVTFGPVWDTFVQNWKASGLFSGEPPISAAQWLKCLNLYLFNLRRDGLPSGLHPYLETDQTGTLQTRFRFKYPTPEVSADSADKTHIGNSLFTMVAVGFATGNVEFGAGQRVSYNADS